MIGIVCWLQLCSTGSLARWACCYILHSVLEHVDIPVIADGWHDQY
jgi:hypothetical protein